ncbi:hypothetical protein [Microbispora siamensis]|uniref:Uncharacterized protein n=1 Tax=Microbispora siamensis TaxID=564413 RepID=A0ABQ4GM08_9ACTN|nr:hypothetical protein [Microbispora siamensis]GIH62467.1 hypothetical protein Msi02_32840 [Microbispora siamensis]
MRDRLRNDRNHPDMVSSAPQAAWLGHPATVTAIGLLIVNDRVLKPLWPGVLTGKLSDLAGMLVAPPLLALLAAYAARIARRVPPGDRTAAGAIALTGALFAWMKATETGAEAAARAWAVLVPSSRVVADPTDLFALPVLAVAWLVWRRAALSTRRDAARARVLVVLPAAVFAVTATSALPPAPSAQAVEVRDGEIVVVVPDWFTITSGDGGRSWHEWTGSPSASPSPSASASPSPSSSPATRACVPADPRRCYRVIPGRLGVEQTADGGATWTVAWEISRGRQGWLDRVYENPDSLGKRSGPAASLAVAVQAVPGGHVVAVANGTDGVALRDVSGRWRRLGFPEYVPERALLSEDAAAPLASPGEWIDTELGVAVLVALAVLLAALGTTAGARRWPVRFWICAAIMWTSVLLVVTADGMITGLISLALFVPMFAVGTAGVLAVWLRWRPRGTPLLLAAPAAFAAVFLPFLGWSAGLPDDYGVAVLLAILLCAAVLVVAVRVAVRARARTRRERALPVPPG